MKETVLNRVLITEQLLNMFKFWCEWILSYQLSITKSDCRWPLRTPTPLKSILWPNIDPILVTFGRM